MGREPLAGGQRRGTGPGGAGGGGSEVIREAGSDLQHGILRRLDRRMKRGAIFAAERVQTCDRRICRTAARVWPPAL